MRRRSSWSNIRGPSEVLWLTLKRTGWIMAFSNVLHRVENDDIDLLRLLPKSVYGLVRQKVWKVACQSRDIAS
eukprot:4357025-Pyramimonas_sp.AAC.1